MYAYYTLIDASDPDLSDEDRAGLLAEYPNCDKVPIYVFDPKATDRERNLILGLWKLYTNLTNDDILQMYTDYDIP